MNRSVNDLHIAFDAALNARTDVIASRQRTPDDEGFLIDCAIACSPMAGLLPDVMLAQQAAMQRAAHDGAHPDAVHRIVMRDGVPIGHILLAWDEAGTHLVDIALLPANRGSGAGTHMLCAWLAVADAERLTAKLEVRTDNPARRLYARLGFVETNPDPWAASIEMHRPPAQR